MYEFTQNEIVQLLHLLAKEIDDMTISCPDLSSVNCIDRESSLLSQRLGFGENTTGGTGQQKIRITSLTDSSFLDAITAGNAWVCFDPSLDGQTWNAPLNPFNGSGLPNQIFLGPNLTIDGRDADVTLQLGVPNSVNQWPWTTTDWTYRPVQLIAQEGNLIMHCLKINGDLGIFEEGTGNFNGTSDFEVWDGQNYWFDHLTISNMSDEALSVFPTNGGIPDLITMSNIRFINNKNDSIIGRQDETFSPRVTQAYNWSSGAVEGRAPGLYYSSRTHVYNTVAEDYNRQGIQVWNNAEVISECNVIDPRCRTNANTTRFAGFGGGATTGVAGKLNDSGSIVITSQSNGGGCNNSTDTNFSEPLANMFQIPYAYTKLPVEQVRDYVAVNAGADSPKETNFCA